MSAKKRYVSSLSEPEANPRDGSRLLRFLVDAPNTDPEIGHNSPRARPCARQGAPGTPSHSYGPHPRDRIFHFRLRLLQGHRDKSKVCPVFRVYGF
jgi:hypothetical protein